MMRTFGVLAVFAGVVLNGIYEPIPPLVLLLGLLLYVAVGWMVLQRWAEIGPRTPTMLDWLYGLVMWLPILVSAWMKTVRRPKG